MQLIQQLEQSLHSQHNRANKAYLEKLLHPEFMEIGYSGKTFDLQTILTELSSEEAPDFEVWTQDYRTIWLSDSLVQLIYLEARLDSEGSLSRFAKRMSIWEKQDEEWKVRFHQATPTQAFKKVATD